MNRLPEWDLGDLYAGPDSAALDDDLKTADHDARAFATEFKGRVAGLDGDALAAAVWRYEEIEARLGRVMTFAQLLFSGDAAAAARGCFLQTMRERVTAISNHVLFFTLEINRIEDGALEGKLSSSALARYRPWLRDLRAFRAHQLSDELEELLHEKAVAGRNGWMRLFEETMAQARFPVDGRELTSSEVLNLLSDRDPAMRKAAAKSFGKVLGENVRLFALITNTLAKDKEVEDKWRRYAKPVSARNLANHVEDEVVDALVGSVRAAYPALAHRYYALKAGWMGQDQLDYWDRNAPLPDDDDRQIPWDEARERVLGAYAGFSGEIAEVAAVFFDKPWIDVAPRPGKASGAFAHPAVPSVHPYILLNYYGKARDVMTLAHELGHGVHQVLAGGQGYLMAGTPLTLAETASVFGEMLTFRSLLDGAEEARRRVMLAAKVEDMLNTVVRQVAFFDFERQMHDERRAGELSIDRLGEIWLGIQTESLGPVFRFDEEYRNYWSYIPHFIHSPFYVYAYAFGDCLVNSLYDVYREGHEGFEGKYVEMLKAGGTLRHKELLAPFGLDATDADFWKRGLGVIEGFINELEKTF